MYFDYSYIYAFLIKIRVKDSAGPCDCIKDLDGSWPEKKT